jgi:hypothetical protein
MKKKISKILGVALTVVLLTSLMAATVPVSALTLSWGAEKSPATLVENTIVTNINILDIATSGSTVYVCTDNSDYPLLKSTDAGETWANMKTSTSFPSGVSVKAIGVASDDVDVIAIVTSADEVEYSTNGGSSWSDLDAPATGAELDDVDVSPGTTRYIAVSGNVSGAAELWTLRATMAQNWTARYAVGNGVTGGAGGQLTAKAVKISPNFVTDKIILVITGGSTNSTLQAFRYETGAETWNGNISFFGTDWGTGVSLESITGGLAAADIALPESYLGTDENERLAFTAVAGTTTGGGVVRVVDNYAKGFSTWNAGDEGKIGSLAYHEAGKIIAGVYDDNKVYKFADPMATTPKADRINTLKQPGGTSKTVVRWAGDTAVAGTSGTGTSAFAVSTDDGYAWNDFSLIDTTLNAFSDVAPSADGSVVYLATNDGTNTSIWRKASRWTRVLNLAGVTSAIVRIAPDDADVVYVADTASQDMWVSKDAGDTSWKTIPCYKLGSGDTIVDLAVESADVAYVIDDDGVSKTTNAGASWGTQERPTDAVTPYMITMASNGDILVGTTEGYVAYSKDGGSTFERTTDAGTPETGKGCQVIPDDDYASNNTIYVGIGTDVKRGKADKTSPFSTRGSLSGNVTGMAQVEEATYALTSTSTASESRLYRSLKLETADTSDAAEWSYASTSRGFLNAPQALKLSVSDTSSKLWAIDTAGDALYSFTDVIALAGPTLDKPADEASVPVNPGTGRSYDITFIFKRYSDSDIDEMQLQIATDSEFNAVIYDRTFTGINTDTIAKVIGPTGQTNQVAEFMPGETYYWRVRTGQQGPMYSPWSEARSFTVEDIAEPFAISGPAAGASDVSLTPTLVWSQYPGAIRYQVELSEDPTFAILEWSYNVDSTFYKLSEPLKYSTTYYWRVRGVTAEPYLVGRNWVTPAGEWATGVFTTMAEPEEEEPTVVTVPGETEVKVVEVPVQTQAPIPAYLLWTIVGVGAVLVIALIVLIVRTRRVA